jgi:hypothetical protein
MDELLKIALSRWVPAIAYVLTIAIVGLLMFMHSLPPGAKATYRLDRNHRLTAEDVETSATTLLIGRYLQKEVDKGQTIDPSMVSDKQVPAPFASGLTALVSMPPTTLQNQKIGPGADVKVCVKTNLLAGPVKVLKIEDCDEQVCWVLVELSHLSGQVVDLSTLTDARLIPAAFTCSSP